MHPWRQMLRSPCLQLPAAALQKSCWCCPTASQYSVAEVLCCGFVAQLIPGTRGSTCSPGGMVHVWVQDSAACCGAFQPVLSAEVPGFCRGCCGRATLRSLAALEVTGGDLLLHFSSPPRTGVLPANHAGSGCLALQRGCPCQLSAKEKT